MSEWGESPEFSGRLRRDVERWGPAALAGDSGALHCLGDLLFYAGMTRAFLERECGEAADSGDFRAVERLRPQLRRGLVDKPNGGISLETQYQQEEYWLTRTANGGSAAAMVALARYLQRTGREPEAEPWLRTAAQAGDPPAMVDLARLAAAAGDPAEAERWLRAAIELGSPLAPVSLAMLLRRQGRTADAVPVLEEALAEGAGNPEELLLLLAHYQPQRAESLLREAIADGSQEALERLAVVLAERGDLVEAERLLREAISVGWIRARGALADVLGSQGRTAEADRERSLAYDESHTLTGVPVDLGTVVVTATVTAAVVPFVQTLAAKAAEDSYHAVRKLLRNLVRTHGRRTREPSGTTGPVLLVKDPDTGAVLRLRPDLPDDALRALTEADLSTPATLVWNADAKRWEQR